jgi:DNA-binding MarR family transcriptional regulator
MIVDMDDTWELLMDLVMAERARLPQIAAEFRLSPPQVYALRLLEPEQPLPMGRLACALGCDASNVTGIVDRLEQRGLIERRPSERDRRVKVLDLNTGTERSLTDTPSTGTWISWSSDSRSIYYTREEPPRGFIIRVVPVAGGSPRTVVYANLPDRQVHRYGFSLAKGRFYFPLVEQKADVWVAEVEPK